MRISRKLELPRFSCWGKGTLRQHGLWRKEVTGGFSRYARGREGVGNRVSGPRNGRRDGKLS